MLEQIEVWISTLSTFEKGLLAYFLVLFIIWLFASDKKPNQDANHPTLKNKTKYVLAVNKKDFIREVVRWGISHLYYVGVSEKRKLVNVEISYHPHKTLKGYFRSSEKKIKVYVNNHMNAEEIIDTSLHEVVHFLQYCADKKNFQTRYSKLLKELTYAKHPMEIEAVKIASSNTKACMKHMIEHGKLKKRI